MESHPLSPPGSIGLLLRLAHRRAARAFAAQLQPLGIDNRQAGVLLQLGQAGPVTQRRLIDLMGSDKSTMVRTVDELEAHGLARRMPHPRDRRAHAVELTPAGRELLARVRAGADRAGSDLLDCLEPEQQRQLHALLTRFAQAPDPADSRELPDQPSS
ncbi:MarR family winged helix-turn-helix transcriptional regulator [Streptacidiphilus sp. P02-A3a]|uniref:MarR family winged helix-turn-helix transcriptional regulator n=1 Tax=Streptacidiphilus sp. P02-A3a TaxID=2704468 RepID=UPI0015FA7FF6|nr:MarR family transcriptional regulator [Streptacidiphilus sp. P02-A3a]QMU68949.1 MarR family transcriptional regulator [Streptacidiphilus sp. P02-A3a]